MCDFDKKNLASRKSQALATPQSDTVVFPLGISALHISPLPFLSFSLLGNISVQPILSFGSNVPSSGEQVASFPSESGLCSGPRHMAAQLEVVLLRLLCCWA